MRLTAIALTLGLLLATGFGCGDSESLQQIQKGLQQTWDGVKSFTVEQRGEAESFFTKSLEGMDDQYEAAKKKASELGGDASEKLQGQWADLSTKLEAMKSASGEKWEKAKDAFVAAYEAFQAEMATESGS